MLHISLKAEIYLKVECYQFYTNLTRLLVLVIIIPRFSKLS